MSESCVPIEDLLEPYEFIRHENQLLWGKGVSQHVHGTDNNRC